MSELLVRVIRGGYTESRHFGDLVVADKSGKILYSVGDFDRFTFWRSAAKPFQLTPFVEENGIEEFNITMEELAVMASSHGGEKKHVKAVESILHKINQNIESLDCGIAPPMYIKEWSDLLKSGEEILLTHNACSGKHSGILALGVLRNICLDNYIKKDHPIQKIILNTISDCCGMNEEDIIIAIDGCGVPVFGMGIDKMAIAYARLVKPDGYFKEKRVKALKTIVSAMIHYPFYVAGTERLDTVLMEVTKGRLVAKLGAESVYNVGIIEEGIGICLKIDDGNYRAIDPVIIKTLKDLDLLSKDELNQLKDRFNPKLRNHRNEIIGELEPVFELNKHF